MEAVKAERERRTAAAAAAAANGARRRPLAPSEKNNAAAHAGRRSEGPSRFKPVVAPPAPTPAPPSHAVARRCSSPIPGRSSADGGGRGSAATCNNRARSADRARPAPSKLSTAAWSSSASAVPPRDAAGDGHGSTPPRTRNAKKASGDLWASASASASASAATRSSSPLLRPRPEPVVQSPPATASKVDRLVQGLPCSEQAKLRPSSGAVAAADRKRSPRRASTNSTAAGDQCENARPSSESPAANPNIIPSQHRWPGMMTTTGHGRSSAGLTTSTAAAAPAEKMASSSRSVSSSDASAEKILHRRRKNKADSSSDDASSQTSESSCRRQNKAISSPVPVLRRSLSSSPRQGLLAAASSPSRSCCQSPSRMRPSATASAPCCQSKCASHSVVEQTVLNYIIADARKGKKSAGQIENIHQLRLLSSRYLQWRFVNAHSEETLSHKNSAESILYNVWKIILMLRDAITITRTNVRQLQQEVKLYDILTEQIGYLEQWPVLEEECNDTLVEAAEALKATTLRLPVTSGAHDVLTLHEQADEIAVRNAISSAVDVMQALSSSIDYVQSKVEDRTSLVSELSVMARQEQVALDQCRGLLATAAKLQVQETSLRTHLMQLRQRSAG